MNNPLTYDHLPYITAAYALFLLTWLWLILSARHRLTQAQTRLNAIDPRHKSHPPAPFSLPPAGRAGVGVPNSPQTENTPQGTHSQGIKP